MDAKETILFFSERVFHSFNGELFLLYISRYVWGPVSMVIGADCTPASFAQFILGVG